MKRGTLLMPRRTATSSNRFPFHQIRNVAVKVLMMLIDPDDVRRVAV
jgi:hypothetical protein